MWLANSTDEGAAGHGLFVEGDGDSVRLAGHWHKRHVVQTTSHCYHLKMYIK